MIEVEGDLDVSLLPVLHGALTRARTKGYTRMVLDLSATQYVTSTAIGLIVKYWKELRDNGGDLKLCGVSPFIRKTLSMLGVEKIIELYASQEEAAKSCT